MPSITDPTLRPEQQPDSTHYSSLSTPPNENDGESTSDDDNNRHSRMTHSMTAGRPVVTGTDVSHELVYLVNEHPLLPTEIALHELPLKEASPAVQEEEYLDTLTDTPANTPVASPLCSDSAEHVNPASLLLPMPGNEGQITEKMSDHQQTPVVQHQPDNTPQHTADIPHESALAPHHPSHLAQTPDESYQGISQHDPHLKLPAVSDVLVPAEELLFSPPATASSPTPRELVLSDVLGGEQPASWNSPQSIAEDEGVLHSAPEVAAVEIEPNEVHHLG